MNKTTTFFVILDSFIQGVLWSVLCFAVIFRFGLEKWWYIVCTVTLLIEIALLTIHQKITFPGIINYLGYPENDKLKELSKINFSDHAINIFLMFAIVYWGIQG